MRRKPYVCQNIVNTKALFFLLKFFAVSSTLPLPTLKKFTGQIYEKNTILKYRLITYKTLIEYSFHL